MVLDYVLDVCWLWKCELWSIGVFSKCPVIILFFLPPFKNKVRNYPLNLYIENYNMLSVYYWSCPLVTYLWLLHLDVIRVAHPSCIFSIPLSFSVNLLPNKTVCNFILTTLSLFELGLDQNIRIFIRWVGIRFSILMFEYPLFFFCFFLTPGVPHETVLNLSAWLNICTNNRPFTNERCSADL